MKTILELRNITHSYHSSDGETPALENVSFQLSQGEFISIVGPSGCGKSTLLSMVAGLLVPENGEIIRNDYAIGYMLQKDHLLEWRTVYQNVLLGLEVQHKLLPGTKEKAYALLEKYGLGQFISAKPSELSGGMRQRAALIRTLIMDPELLLLDEPFSALDYQTRLSVADDIGQIIKAEGKTAILVTHDLAEAVTLGDRILVLSSRPGTVKNILSLEFPAHKNTPLLRRDTEEFHKYFQTLWSELNGNESYF